MRRIALTSRLVANLCVGLIFVMLGLLVTQVLMRYFLGAPPSWTEELAIILFAWLVLLYATVGLREGFHVAVESIPARFARLHAWADRLVATLAILFGWVTLTAGIAYVEVLYLCVPVCGALFILHGLARLIGPAVPPKVTA